jgi:Protein of unknown function (DUF2510)
VGPEVDEQQRAVLERERPVDLVHFTWAAWIDWVMGVAIALVLLTLVTIVSPDGFFFGYLIAVFGGLYPIGWWRVRRMSPGLDLIERDALQGRFSAVVRIRSGKYFQFIWSTRQTSPLTVGDGWVALGSERWPVGSVSVGPPPNSWTNRGIELRTPSGPRFFSFARPGDPAMYLGAILDRRARGALGRALDGQREGLTTALNAAGWYPDPAGSRAWRWWDGQQWGPLSDQR